MKPSTPRLRMFAGPNGSGKSTLKTVLSAELLGVYLNPDEIESLIRQQGYLAAEDYGVIVDTNIDNYWLSFFTQSNLRNNNGLSAESAKLNISRVQNRVKQGGHPVPEDKIVNRYHRSLDLLIDAIRHANRAYIFDNSGHNQERTWLAEITDGHTLEIKSDRTPAWFAKAVLEKISSEAMKP